MALRLKLNPDQESLYRLLQSHREELTQLLDNMTPAQIMASFIDLGIGFCWFLEESPERRLEIEKHFRTNKNLSGLIKLAVWLKNRAQMPEVRVLE